jgi:hypothetical protein
VLWTWEVRKYKFIRDVIFREYLWMGNEIQAKLSLKKLST